MISIPIGNSHAKLGSCGSCNIYAEKGPAPNSPIENFNNQFVSVIVNFFLHPIGDLYEITLPMATLTYHSGLPSYVNFYDHKC